MRYFVIFLVLVGFVGLIQFGNNAYGLWIPASPEDLVEQSDTILVGTVTASTPIDVEYQSQISQNGTKKDSVGPEFITLDKYTINVEEFLKNPLESNTITVLSATVGGVPGGPARISGFEVGDHVLLYLPNDKRHTHFEGQYLPESFKIPKQCDAMSVLKQPRIELTNSYNVFQDDIAIKDNYTAGIPMNFVVSKDMHTLFDAYFDVIVSIRKEGSNQVLFEKNIHSESESCQWIASAQWEFTPEAGNYRMYLNIRENGRIGGDTSYTGFSVISETKTSVPPLQQFQSGIPFTQIQCKDNLVLIQKYDGTPACVKSETKQKLIERGWNENHDDKITIKDYKIDCNNQTNPHQEYECFKNAYSNCKIATVNLEIYTIEGDPIYTELNITPDCKIHGVADMSTDRFWGTPEIIATTCDEIDLDEYGWWIKNCDAEKLPEMQFNFEMQLYPKILECEENGNTWNRDTLSCINEYNNSGESIWKNYVTVSASRNDDPALADALPVHSMVKNSDNDLLLDLLLGADGCKDETEVCKISGGVSIDRRFSFLPQNVLISDNDRYTITIDAIQAEQLRTLLDWKQHDGSFYSVVHFDEKQYFLILSTFDSKKTPDVKMDILGTSAKPVALEKGQLLNYTIVVTAWSTYGTDAQIDLDARQNTMDSEIHTWIEPKTFYVKERSNATATLFISAQDNAKDGIYDIRVTGKANGKNAQLYCSTTQCPTVKVGDSDWSISTFGSDSWKAIGSGQSNPDTWMELKLDNKEFFLGDTVEIRAYLVNNGTEKIQFIPSEMLITVIKAEPVGYYENLYGIDAIYESDKSIVLEPNSEILLVRPFYWNQTTFTNIDEQQRLIPKQYQMIARFVGEDQTWDDDVWFEIK